MIGFICFFQTAEDTETAEKRKLGGSLHHNPFKFARRDKIFTAPHRVYLGGGRDFALWSPRSNVNAPTELVSVEAMIRPLGACL
jgi:hypothetical protein